jgi:hypothetical protein
MNKFTILGERCSGTNFLEHAILNNFELEITWKYGWKHFFGFSDYTDSENVLFISIVRDPEQWLSSFYKQKFHLNIEMRKNWTNFLTSSCWSYDDEFGSGSEIMEDRNIQTKERYKNIFEMRKIKALFMLDELPKKVKNSILIRYEDLLNNYQEVLNEIQLKFSLKRKHKKIVYIDKYRGNGDKFLPKKYSIPDEYRKIYDRELDKEVEKRLGYIKL